MHLDVAGDLRVDAIEERVEIDRRARRQGLIGAPPRGCVQRGEQRHGAVPQVVMGRSLSGFRCNDLRPLAQTQHQRLDGRVQVQPDDVADLRDELRVQRQRPDIGTMRPQPEGPPDTRHRGLGQSRLPGDRAGRPVPGVRRPGTQRRLDHGLDLRVADAAGRSGSRLVQQPHHPPLDESRPPPPDRLLGHPEPLAHRDIRGAGGALQHDPRPQRELR